MIILNFHNRTMVLTEQFYCKAMPYAIQTCAAIQNTSIPFSKNPSKYLGYSDIAYGVLKKRLIHVNTKIKWVILWAKCNNTISKILTVWLMISNLNVFPIKHYNLYWINRWNMKSKFFLNWMKMNWELILKNKLRLNYALLMLNIFCRNKNG